MFKCSLVGLSFLLFSTLHANQRLEIPSSQSVEGGAVYVHNVAKLNGFTGESLEILKNTVLIENIRTGEMRKLSDQAITDVLRRKINTLKRIEAEAGKDFNLVLKLPKLLSVYVSSPVWTEKSITKSIEKNNKQYCANCTYKLSKLSLPRVAYKKVSRWEMEVPDKFISGRFQIPLRVYYHGKPSGQTFYIGGTLTAFKKMPVAKRNLRAGLRIQESDIIWERRKWNFVRRDIGSPKELVGAKIKRTALSGSIIWLSNLEREKAVESGDLVDIIVRKSDWEMRMKGVAQKSGVLGDTLPILNRSSKKVILGRVTGKQEVELQ